MPSQTQQSFPWIKQILFDQTQIATAVSSLAKQLNTYYRNSTEPIILLGLLKGCIPFFAALIKELTFWNELDFMIASSFKGGTKAEGAPKIVLDMKESVANRRVLIVEDVIDSGKTLALIRDYVLLKGAKEVKIVTLVDKPHQRKVDLKPDWAGLTAPLAFLVGFGLDYQGLCRGLPYIAIADEAKIAAYFQAQLNLS